MVPRSYQIATLIFAFVVSLAIVLVILWPTNPPAKVGDSVISEEQLNQRVAAISDCDSDVCFQEARRSALGQLISERWISLDIKRLGVSVADGEVERYYATALASWKDSGRQGLRPTKTSIKNQLAKDKLSMRQPVGRAAIARAAEEIDNSQPKADSSPTTVRRNLQVIFTRLKTRIQLANASLKAGQPFDQVVRKFSEAPTAKSGGYVDNVTSDALGPKAAFYFRAYPPGKTFGPVSIPGGWAIIRIVSISQNQPRYLPPKDNFEELSRLAAGRKAVDESLRTRYLKETICQSSLRTPFCGSYFK